MGCAIGWETGKFRIVCGTVFELLNTIPLLLETPLSVNDAYAAMLGEIDMFMWFNGQQICKCKIIINYNTFDSSSILRTNKS